MVASCMLLDKLRSDHMCMGSASSLGREWRTTRRCKMADRSNTTWDRHWPMAVVTMPNQQGFLVAAATLLPGV